MEGRALGRLAGGLSHRVQLPDAATDFRATEARDLDERVDARVCEYLEAPENQARLSRQHCAGGNHAGLPYAICSQTRRPSALPADSPIPVLPAGSVPSLSHAYRADDVCYGTGSFGAHGKLRVVPHSKFNAGWRFWKPLSLPGLPSFAPCFNPCTGARCGVGTPFAAFLPHVARSGKLLTILAEREGFEPSVRISPYTRLAGVHLRPLGHLSATRTRGPLYHERRRTANHAGPSAKLPSGDLAPTHPGSLFSPHRHNDITEPGCGCRAWGVTVKALSSVASVKAFSNGGRQMSATLKAIFAK